MKVTKLYSRLPNIAGIPFDGFEDVKIKSREIVRQEIEDFIRYCKKDAKGATARVILGEWGEGKTEIYYSFIFPFAKEHNDYAFFVSASTLANCYDDKDTRKILDTTTLTALKFLVALFKGVIDEAKDENIKKIPRMEDYINAEDYIEEVLKTLLRGDSQRRIFIFIDEFEELLLNRETLKIIVSGIKETINGVYSPIHENGKYQGSLHFFISCTPDAFYKLQTSEDISLIFGGLGRRITGTGVIKLPEIRKKEGMLFLWGLLQFSYSNRLPEPLPIENLGIFNLLLKICQNNLGNLTTLFVDLFKSARKNGELQIIGYEQILNYLEKAQIFVYGGQTPCIEGEVYSRITKYLKDQKDLSLGEFCNTLFRLFIGEVKPFSIEELKKKTGKDKKHIQDTINIINENIKSREKIDKAIIKVAPLKNDKNLDDILKHFDEYIMIDNVRNEKVIAIENYSRSLNEFIDRITYYSLEDKSLRECIFLPVDDTSIRIFFEDLISEEKSIELRNVFRKLINDEEYYIASDVFLTQIFPTPVPKGLEFIQNRDLRLKLWRSVSRDLFGEYEKYMPKAFLKLLKESEIYSFTDEKDYNNYSIVQLVDKSTETSLRVLFYSINGDIKGSDIEEVCEILKSHKKIHLVVLLYTGEITQHAQQKISDKEIGEKDNNLLLYIHLHPTLSKRIICAHKASIETNDVSFDKEGFKWNCKQIVTEELLFDKKIQEWIRSQEKRGVVISQISTSAKSLKEFADALKFYINYMEDANSPDDIFKRNTQEILKLRKYGTKTGLLPSDFESPQKIAELSTELNANGFLQKIDGKYKVIEHPVERRIIQIIQKEGRITVSDLSDYFIVKELKKKVFEDVYLNILEYKGKIESKNGYYSLVDENRLYEEIKNRISRFKKSIEAEYFKKFGHFYVTKERDYSLIMSNDFENFLTEIFDTIETLKLTSQTDILLQKMSLCVRLLDLFESDFSHAIRGAYDKGEEILEKTQNDIDDVKKDLQDIVNNSNKWLRIDFSIKDIDEYAKIDEMYDNIKKIHEKIFSYEELKKELENLPDNQDKKLFKFDKAEEDACYFNIKLFKLKQLQKEIYESIENIRKFVDRIKPIFNEINDRENELNNKLKIKEIPEDYRMSKNILCALKSIKLLGESKTDNYREKKIKLKEIEKSLNDIAQGIKRMIGDLITIVDSLEEIIEKEKEFLSKHNECVEFLKKIQNILDTVSFKGPIEAFEGELTKIKDEYIQRSNQNITTKEEIKKKVRDFNKALEIFEERTNGAKENLRNEWESYRHKIVKRTNRIKDMLTLLSKTHKINVVKINQKIDLLYQKINVSLDELNDKISSLENLEKEIKQLAMSISRDYITENEAKILDVLYSKKEEKLTWISREELVKMVGEKYKLTEKEINTSIENLISKKYIIQGFSLTL